MSLSAFDQSPDVKKYNWSIICSRHFDILIEQYNDEKDQLVDTIPTLTITLSSIGIVVNSVFVFLVGYGLKKDILPFKGHSLLLHRSVTDLISGFITLIFCSLHKFDRIPPNELNATSILEYIIPHGRTVFTFLLTLNFWAVAGAYGTLAMLTYIAIRYPWYYQTTITNRKTVIIMIIMWLIGIIYSILVVSLSSNSAFNVFNTENDLIQWSVSKEDYLLSISNMFIVVLALTIVTFSYIAIIIYLFKKSAQSGWNASGKIISLGNASLHFTSIGRLSINIFAFTATCFVMMTFISLPLFLKTHIDDLNNLDKVSMCETVLETYRLAYEMAIWTTMAMSGWMLRITLDPAINIILDQRLREIASKIWETPREERSSKVKPISFLSTSEFLNKCAHMNVIPSSILPCHDGHYFRFRSPTEMEAKQQSTVKRAIVMRSDYLLKVQNRVL